MNTTSPMMEAYARKNSSHEPKTVGPNADAGRTVLLYEVSNLRGRPQQRYRFPQAPTVETTSQFLGTFRRFVGVRFHGSLADRFCDARLCHFPLDGAKSLFIGFFLIVIPLRYQTIMARFERQERSIQTSFLEAYNLKARYKSSGRKK